jgi:hypothetical protein
MQPQCRARHIKEKGERNRNAIDVVLQPALTSSAAGPQFHHWHATAQWWFFLPMMLKVLARHAFCNEVIGPEKQRRSS